MPLPFSYLCTLLQTLEDNLQSRTKDDAKIINDWFQKYHRLLPRDENGIAALLSTLLPEKRSDRVYAIKEKRLQAVIARGLILGRSRIQQLGRWSESGSGMDLARCVENILKETPNPVLPGRIVTVEEVDGILHQVAAGCRFSSPTVRSSAPNSSRAGDSDTVLGDLYRRLSAQEAKWFTRLLLKNYMPLLLDPQLIYRCYDPLLPKVVKVQDDIVVAARVLVTIRTAETAGKVNLSDYLKPTLGVKIGRQPWFKGRSIQHCLDMGHGRMSCEEKIDGEYCQIHIDLSKGRDCIQIFSKSGKDSTMDRVALHGSIRESLQLGKSPCPIKKGCILEGELVVYSDKDNKILDFHKIRKHVSRSGSFLGTDQDSQRHHWEHLMIVYYDLFMLDDESFLSTRQSDRFKRLKELVTVVPGRSSLVNREIIDFDRRSARSDLRRAFAKCIVSRGEGLVLKPDDPYFDFSSSRKPFSCCAIKLKKEYIGNFGEIGDFAVVGARFDAAKARAYTILNVKWTHFYIGVLENQQEVRRFDERPKFVVTSVVELNQAQMEMFVRNINPESVPFSENSPLIKLRLEPGIDVGKRPSVLFPNPPVFDIRCFSFDKEGNTGFWGPRFPMVNKIHCDRSYKDVISFQELQDIAIKEKEEPPPEDSQELLGWINKLAEADPKRAASELNSQSTVATTEPPSSQVTRSSASQLSDATVTLPNAVRQIDGETTFSQSTPHVAPKPPTTPRSTAIHKENTDRVHRNQSLGNVRKRAPEAPLEQSPERNKTRRRSAEGIQKATSPPSPSSRANASPSRREPLGKINETSPRRNHDSHFPARLVGVHSMYQPALEKEDSAAAKAISSSLPASLSFHEGATRRPVFPATQPVASSFTAGSMTNNCSRREGNTTNVVGCKYLSTSCALSNTVFLLAPCISGFLWVTEDLLGCHGIVDFARDPAEWAPKPTSSDVCPSANASSKRARRKRKVVLVDPRRKEATKAFLARVEGLGLTRPKGGRDVVPVFDWRVLEALKEEEERVARTGERPGLRFDMNSGSSIWSKFWVGLA